MTPGAQHDVGMNPLAPQIEKPVGEPHLLGIFGLGVDRERQRLGFRLDFELPRSPARPRRWSSFGLTVSAERAVTRPVTVTTLSRRSPSAVGEQRRGGVDHALREPVMVAQIDEQQMAVVALAVDPARQPGRVSGIGKAQLPAGMAPISMHCRLIVQIGVANEGYRHGTKIPVKASPAMEPGPVPHPVRFVSLRAIGYGSRCAPRAGRG